MIFLHATRKIIPTFLTSFLKHNENCYYSCSGTLYVIIIVATGFGDYTSFLTKFSSKFSLSGQNSYFEISTVYTDGKFELYINQNQGKG